MSTKAAISYLYWARLWNGFLGGLFVGGLNLPQVVGFVVGAALLFIPLRLVIIGTTVPLKGIQMTNMLGGCCMFLSIWILSYNVLHVK